MTILTYPFGNRRTCYWPSSGQNYAKYNAGRHLDALQIVQLDDTSIDGTPVYVLRVDEPKRSRWPALLYIRCDNYAIARAEEQYDHSQQFAVTDMTIQDVDRFSPKEILREDVSLKKLPVRYDPQFWTHYNISPLDTAIQCDLEQKMSLEAQFRMP